MPGKAHTGKGCLELEIDGKDPAPADLFFKASYIRADFEGERYEPVFSPRVYPGQVVSCWMKSCQTAPAEIVATPFVTRAMAGDRIDLPAVTLPREAWKQIAFSVPDLEGDQVHDIGWKNETVLEARDGSLAYGMLGVCQGEGTASRWSGFHIAASV